LRLSLPGVAHHTRARAIPSSLTNARGRGDQRAYALRSETPAAPTLLRTCFRPSIRRRYPLCRPKDPRCPRWRSSSARPATSGVLRADDDESRLELGGERHDRGRLVARTGLDLAGLSTRGSPGARGVSERMGLWTSDRRECMRSTARPAWHEQTFTGVYPTCCFTRSFHVASWRVDRTILKRSSQASGARVESENGGGSRGLPARARWRRCRTDALVRAASRRRLNDRPTPLRPRGEDAKS